MAKSKKSSQSKSKKKSVTTKSKKTGVGGLAAKAKSAMKKVAKSVVGKKQTGAKKKSSTTSAKAVKSGASKKAGATKKAALTKTAPKNKTKELKPTSKKAKTLVKKTTLKSVKKGTSASQKAGRADVAKSTLKAKKKSNSAVATKVSSKSPAKSQKGNRASKVVSLDLQSFFTPLDDRVLVQQDGVSDRTPGGLFIPETATSVSKPNKGLVVAVGRGRLDKKGKIHHMDVKLGDRVLFASFAGSEMTIEGHAVMVLRENDILAIEKT